MYSGYVKPSRGLIIIAAKNQYVMPRPVISPPMDVSFEDPPGDWVDSWRPEYQTLLARANQLVTTILAKPEIENDLADCLVAPKRCTLEIADVLSAYSILEPTPDTDEEGIAAFRVTPIVSKSSDQDGQPGEISTGSTTHFPPEESLKTSVPHDDPQPSIKYYRPSLIALIHDLRGIADPLESSPTPLSTSELLERSTGWSARAEFEQLLSLMEQFSLIEKAGVELLDDEGDDDQCDEDRWIIGPQRTI